MRSKINVHLRTCHIMKNGQVVNIQGEVVLGAPDGESALLCGQFVPEAVHNPVAIKLLESSFLT